METDVIYYGLFLDERYRQRLWDGPVRAIAEMFEDSGYFDLSKADRIYLDHVTLAFNTQFQDNPEVVKFCEENLGKKVGVAITAVGFSERAAAFKVYLGNDIPCANSNPHITIATFNGGKPVESNNITNWMPLQESVGFVTTVGAFRKKKK